MSDNGHIPDLSSNQMCQTQELYCPECGRFIMLQAIVWGSIQVKCPNSKCKKIVTVDINPEIKEETTRY
ncbi:MAG: hypothetical protein PHQ43_05500 [Dehalococcoidales bacterium]|nr:hypothetical protein [Dehalococcoidales bacterium]